MAIILDTTEMPRKGPLRTILISTILQIGRIKGFAVLLPQPVLDESVSARTREAGETFEKLTTILASASRYYDLESFYIPSGQEVGEIWKTELVDAFDIISMHPDDASEALRREAHRIPPARDGRGARDTAIWLSALRYHREHSGLTYFVSKNYKDFGTQDGDLQAPLQAELGNDSEFKYVRGCDELLALISRKSEWQISQELFSGSKREIEQAVLAQFDWSSAGIDASRGSSLEIQSLGNFETISAFEVDNIILAQVKLTFSGLVFDGSLVELLRSEKQVVELVRNLQFETRCWVQLNSEEARFEAVDIEDIELLSNQQGVSTAA